MRPATQAPRRSDTLRRSLVYGGLWSVAIVVGEALSLPLGLFGQGAEQFSAMRLIFIGWFLTGVGLAWVALHCEAMLDTHWKLALCVLLLSLASALLNQLGWFLVVTFGVDVDAYRRLGAPGPSWAKFIYVLWMTLFHGGVFIAACVLLMRAERSQRLLGSAQIARRRTEALLEEAEFDALRGRVDPAFLLRAMDAVQACYARDAAAADRLLDQLVGFLRSAMPIVRSGSSSLKTEVALAQDYAALSAAIDTDRTRWHVQVQGSLPEVAFPPLLLLPLMDHCGHHDAVPPGLPCEARLSIASDADRIEIVVEAVGAAGALPYRLQVALGTAFGNGWSAQPMPVAPPRGVAMRLRIAHGARGLWPPTGAVATLALH